VFFVFNGYVAVFVHHGTDDFRQGFVFGMRLHVKYLYQKVGRSMVKFAEKAVNVESHISLKRGQFAFVKFQLGRTNADSAEQPLI